MDNNTFCYCVTGYYYDKTYDYCLAQSTYGGSCSQSSSQCLNVNLVCINNYCICSGTQYWNGTYCVDYVLFSQPCTASTQCNPNDLYLTCGIPPLGKLFYYNQHLCRTLCCIFFYDTGTSQKFSKFQYKKNKFSFTYATLSAT